MCRGRRPSNGPPWQARLRRYRAPANNARVRMIDGHAAESEPKTANGQRVVALDPITHEAMRGYAASWASERHLLAQPTSGLLFVWPDGRPLHPDTITKLFHKHVAAAGLPRIRLHDVRHSYA